MHAPDHPDPWSSLAESLGVNPGAEPPPPAPASPPKPAAPRAADRPKPKAPPPPPASWDALASDLGIAPTAGEPPPRRVEPPRQFEQRPPRPVGADEGHAERRRPPARDTRDETATRRDQDRSQDRNQDRNHDRNQDRDHDRNRDRDDDRRLDRGHERDRDREVAHDAERGEYAAARPPRGDDHDAGREPGAASGHDGDRDGDRGERRGGRRRGRRGGRGRRDGAPREGRESAAVPTRPVADFGDEDSRRLDDRSDEPRWDEAAPAGDAGGDAPARERGPEGSDQGDDQPRRRRRRCRRGGRGRSRTGRDAHDAAAGDRERGAETGGRPEDADDEPLPTSYGMRPAPRPPEDRARDDAGERRGDGERSGGSRGRRRRRRGGEGRAASGDTGRSRRSSRRGGEERTRPARTARVRRADFAPVSGTFDEDDEGLEFLGVEDADREPRRRAPRTEEDVLAESGLDSVREVPSWVEAIGIVIAGNLDARSRGRGDGGRHRDR